MEKDRTQDRRGVLKTLSAVSISGIAGCSGLTSTSKPAQTPQGTGTTTGSTSIAELKERNNDLRSQVDRLEANVTAKQDTVDHLREELKKERTRVAELEANLDDTNTAELQRKLDAREERIDDLEATIKELQKQTFPEEIIEQAQTVGSDLKQSVVYLYKDLDPGSTSGTGWFIDSETIVSNGHVVAKQMYGDEMYESMTAFLPDGTSFSVTPLAKSHGMVDNVHVDMAVLSAERSGTPVNTGEEDSLSMNQPIVQNGHPSNVGEWVTSLGKFLGFEEFRGLTSTIPTRGGNSGSPVATLDGRVVGLTASTFVEGPDTGNPSNPSPSSDRVYTTVGYRDTIDMVTAHTPISTVKQFVADNS